MDGEGSVTITSRGRAGNTEQRYFYVAVRIANCDKKMLEHLQQLWGGTVHTSGTAKGGWHQGYVLTWGPRAAVIPLEAMLPYLHIKRPQALIALEFARLTGRSRVEKGMGYGSAMNLREWGYRNYLAWLVRHYNGLTRSGDRSFKVAWGAA